MVTMQSPSIREMKVFARFSEASSGNTGEQGGCGHGLIPGTQQILPHKYVIFE